MMAGMDTYRFVGGSMNGRTMETDGAHVVVVPLMRPVEVFSKVVPFRRSRFAESFDREEYQKFGHIYWWDGLVRDAGSHLAVSDEVMVEGGSVLRKVIREELRRNLEDIAAGKGLGRIVWRVRPDRRHGMHEVTALVGPRAVEQGLRMRSERRSGIPV